MLTIDEQLFDIDEAIDEVAASFLELESVKNYRKAREVFLADTSTISSDIFVETGLPLAPHKSHYGNCSKGGRKKHV